MTISIYWPRHEVFYNQPISMDSHCVGGSSQFDDISLNEVILKLKDCLELSPNSDSVVSIEKVNDPLNKTIIIGDSQGIFWARFERLESPKITHESSQNEKPSFWGWLFSLFDSESSKPIPKVAKRTNLEESADISKIIESIKLFMEEPN